MIPLPGGRTRLEGTTWYENRMYPVAYWRMWSDTVIHRIHLNVLGHIKRLAEGEVAVEGKQERRAVVFDCVFWMVCAKRG